MDNMHYYRQYVQGVVCMDSHYNTETENKNINRFWCCPLPAAVKTSFKNKVPDGSMSSVVGLPNNSYKPITNTAWVRSRFGKLQKWCTRLAAASDKVYQLLAHCRWFSLGTPASSTTNTGHHDIAEILLKMAINTKKIKIKSNNSKIKTCELR